MSFDRNLPRPPVAQFALLRNPVTRYWAAVYQNHRGDDLAGHLDDVLDHNRHGGALWDSGGDLHFLDQHRFWPADEHPELFRLDRPAAFVARMAELGVDGPEFPHRGSSPDRWKALVADRVTDADNEAVAARYVDDLALWEGV